MILCPITIDAIPSTLCSPVATPTPVVGPSGAIGRGVQGIEYRPFAHGNSGLNGRRSKVQAKQHEQGVLPDFLALWALER